MATAAEIAAIFSSYGAPLAAGSETADQRMARLAQQVTDGTRTLADVTLWAQHLAAGTQPSAQELAAVGTSNVSVYNQPTNTSSATAAVPGSLNSIPEGDEAQIWQDTNTGGYFLVYFVPGTQIPLMYWATGEQVQSYFGPGQPIVPDRYGTRAQFDQMGALIGGRATELSNLTANPFDAWASAYGQQTEINPWLAEPEMAALSAQALLEGREVSEAEFKTTNWWTTHNEAERQWLLLYNSDPSSAQQLLDQNRAIIQDQLRRSGSESTAQATLDAMSREFTMGRWDSVYLQNQIKALTDPSSGIPLSPVLMGVAGTQPFLTGTTKDQETKVRDLVQQWVGPAYGQWPDSQVSYWAGRLRNDPDAETELVEMLKNQRSMVLPEYTDRNATYQDIAGPWRSLFQRLWGSAPDEMDNLWHSVIRTNDAGEAAKLLRAEGLKRGNKTVTEDVMGAVGEASSNGLRRAIS